MERLGPEALMVLARIAPRWEDAEYARLEYPCEDLRVLAAGLRPAPVPEADDAEAAGGWILRAAAWLRARSSHGEDGRTDVGDPEPRALAAVPALKSEVDRDGAATPVWAIPALARSPPQRPA
jgi:hypothetical protein